MDAKEIDKPRRGRPPDGSLAERRRGEILEHAIRHFARAGFASADLDAIVADVGCAKGTVYRYFRNKEDLFHGAVDEVMRGLLEATSAVTSDDPIQQLEHAIVAYLTYFDEHPEFVELLILERAEFRTRKRPTYFDYREASSGRWMVMFAELMKSGRFRQMPPQHALDAIGNLLYGTIFTNYFVGRTHASKRHAAEIVDVLFRGLLTPAEAAQRDARRETDR
jgi:AcrR family transcriptional regulator